MAEDSDSDEEFHLGPRSAAKETKVKPSKPKHSLETSQASEAAASQPKETDREIESKGQKAQPVDSVAELTESLHAMKMRHKQELANLKASFGGKKKKKKGAGEQLKLQTKLLQIRHEEELQKHSFSSSTSPSSSLSSPSSSSSSPSSSSPSSSSTHSSALSPSASDGTSNGPETGGKKSKAQRKREKKAREEAERRKQYQAEAAAMSDHRAIENEALAKQLLPLGLTVHQVAADGHCLYRAISHQLDCQSGPNAADPPNHLQLRQVAATHLLDNADHFGPFITDPSGAPLAPSAYAAYCSAITQKSPVVWGGHPEIVALAHALHRQIVVHSAGNTKPMTIGDGGTGWKPPLHISWHRHSYSLGEHYNSVVPVASD